MGFAGTVPATRSVFLTAKGACLASCAWPLSGRRVPASKQREQLTFKVDSSLLYQLGEELVSNRVTALAELIKNAYDADATKVTVRLRDTTAPGGAITIRDDGAGMTRQEIRDHWMTIATAHKRDKPYSANYQRYRAGNKGIGRFAMRRLSRRLVMTSVARTRDGEGFQGSRISVDWDALQPGKPIDAFPAHLERLETQEGPSGLTLDLVELRDAWTEADIDALYSDLATLVEPIPERRRGGTQGHDPGFDVELTSSDFPRAAGRLSEQFLHGAYAKLNGRIRADVARYQLQVLKGPSKGRDFEFEHRDVSYARLDGVRFSLHFIRYIAGDFLGLPISLPDARTVGRRRGGVRIYLDGFRVPAYGSPGDDWLKLDEDRANRQTTTREELRDAAGKQHRPMLALPGNNSLFGKVALMSSREHPFRQTLDRERLVEDTDFESLRKFVRLGVDWMTVIYARQRAKEASRKATAGATVRQALQRARALIEEHSERIGEERAKNIVQALKLAGSMAEAQRAQHIGELSMLRVLASTGTMLLVFTHQLQLMLEGLRSAYRRIKRYSQHLPKDVRDEYMASLGDLDEWIDSAEQQAQLLGMLHGKDARMRRRRIALREFISQVGASFSGYIQDHGIECDLRSGIAADHRTPPMYEAELGAILVNLMTNALKAVKGVRDRRIGVFSERRDDGLTLRFCDSGMGASQKNWSRYFEPFYSESEPDPILGTGTGLGLKIVKDLVEMHGGTVRFQPPPKGWSTCVELLFVEEQ